MKKLLLFSAALLACASLLAQEAVKTSEACDQLGWKVAVHAYTFRKFSIWECMDKTAALGLKYMSISGNVNLTSTNSTPTVNLSDKDAQAIKDYAAKKGLTLVNIGVVQLSTNEVQSRKAFEIARKLGIDTLVAEPPEAAMDVVEKLCKEYNIKVAIHDHPRPSHYWNPDTVLAAIKGRSPLIGACADTGHWLRSGLDPVECLKKLDGHVICLHFKDLVPDESKPGDAAKKKGKKSESRAMHDVPWGQGVGNIKAQMAELKRQGFHGAFCIEYEYHWENSSPEIAEGLKYFYATAAELAKP